MAVEVPAAAIPDGQQANAAASARGLLLELSIRDFAIIDELRLTLDEGLNALTGETGAGKSILIDALGAVLGDRVGPHVVRAGAERALIEATFQRPAELPRELELDEQDDVLILSREIAVNGRSTARVNGRAVPVSLLQLAGRALVDVHGQSDHQSLLRTSTHVHFLDRFARAGAERDRMAAVVGELRQVRQEIATLQLGVREAARQQDLLRFQIDEIEKAGLTSGEDDELQRTRTVLANAEKLAEMAASALACLSGEGSAIDSALAASKHLDDIIRLDPSLAAQAASLGEAAETLRDVGRALSRYADQIEANPAELQRVEDRLDAIRTLKRKYGETIEEILAFAGDARRQLDDLTDSDMRLEQLQEREKALLARARQVAAELTSIRQGAAEKLAAEIEAQLADLNMKGARFEVSMHQREGDAGLQAAGVDEVEFLMAANPGEPPRPLAQVASGGEASRLMLALKSVFSAVDDTPVLVFDEIEAGVGARGGHVIGDKLQALAQHHQVLCITHLAPVAALADAHFRVLKMTTDGSTQTTVERLAEEVRVEELAEMLAGRPISDAARESAKSLLRQRS